MGLFRSFSDAEPSSSSKSSSIKRSEEDSAVTIAAIDTEFRNQVVNVLLLSSCDVNRRIVVVSSIDFSDKNGKK